MTDSSTDAGRHQSRWLMVVCRQKCPIHSPLSFITPLHSRRPLAVESVLNTALAGMLRGMRHTWDVVPEAKGSLQSKSKQPDLVITERGSDPIIIENEYAPAQTVEVEAKSRLGMVHANTNRKIRAVIALCTPIRLKNVHWRSLPRSLRTATDFKYAVYTPARYPTNGWLGGGWQISRWQYKLPPSHMKMSKNMLTN